jgi:hypothetical protein
MARNFGNVIRLPPIVVVVDGQPFVQLVSIVSRPVNRSSSRFDSVPDELDLNRDDRPALEQAHGASPAPFAVRPDRLHLGMSCVLLGHVAVGVHLRLAGSASDRRYPILTAVGMVHVDPGKLRPVGRV